VVNTHRLHDIGLSNATTSVDRGHSDNVPPRGALIMLFHYLPIKSSRGVYPLTNFNQFQQNAPLHLLDVGAETALPQNFTAI
jgi:hypothetical protein